MLIALNNTGYSNEYAGIGSIAAYLESVGKKVEILQIDLDSNATFNEIEGKIPIDYNLYGFYIIYTNAELVLESIKWLKKHNTNCYTFVGGHCATASYKYILADCGEMDFVVLGDGEYPLNNVIEALKIGKNLSDLDSIATREDNREKYPAVSDITKLPWIKRYYYLKGINNIYVNARMVSSKKCLGNCSFCSTIHSYRDVHSHQWDSRDMEDVVEELKSINKQYGIKYFSFIDPSFEDPGLSGKERIREFCELILKFEEKLYFWCYLRTETFDKDDKKDIELIKLMRAAGFAKVFIGIESMNQDDLRLYGKRATIQHNRESLNLFSKYGFEVVPGFIMINPLSTKESLKKNFEFLVENRIYLFYTYITVIELFHKTPLYNKISKLGLILDSHSYKNPFGYKVQDSYVNEVFEFIVGTILQSNICTAESQFLYRDNFVLTSIKEFFPNEYKKYAAEIRISKEKLVDTIDTYMRLLFVDYNIDLAKKEFRKFESDMELVYNSFKNITFKFLRFASVRDYFNHKQSK